MNDCLTFAYEENKALFRRLKAAYFPVCCESASGEPVGTIALVLSGNRGYVATLAVIPSFQRRGIGSLLLERALDYAWHADIRTLELSVRVENPRTVSLYGRFGFQEVPGRTTIVMQMDV